MVVQEKSRENIYQLNDGMLRIIGIPAISIVATFLCAPAFPGVEQEPKGRLLGLMFLLTFVTWSCCRFILLWTRRKFPEIRNTRQRILYTYLLYTLASAVIVTLYIIASKLFHWYTVFEWSVGMVMVFFLINLFFCYTMGAIYESIYFFRHWKRTTLETEQLKREGLQTRYDSLKNQVNPHFLFNSLNSLSTLIEEDADRAEEFVQEMSRVYRYLLQSNDRVLTSLSLELDFIKAYFYLLKTRFNEGIRLEINVPEKYSESQVPPLTLQLLVENAVKHNVVSAAKPLIIKIFVDENKQLVVSNNRQPKTQVVISNKIGLENIRVKYKLLNQPVIQVRDTAVAFEVIVPLIDKEAFVDSSNFQNQLQSEISLN